jgi:hypothetical protein
VAPIALLLERRHKLIVRPLFPGARLRGSYLKIQANDEVRFMFSMQLPEHGASDSAPAEQQPS